jgi:hypothetical protein
MTLQEKEDTLEILTKRHPGLNEVMLVTLLRAGGWEEKDIEEARLLFRGGAGSGKEEKVLQKEFPTLLEIPVLPPEIDNDHLLVSKEVMEQEEKGESMMNTPRSPEPQSFVAPSPAREEKREELPHNLPLRPFETSEHVWPFSRYRDVFYGDVGEEAVAEPAPQVKPEEKKEPVIEVKVVPPPEPLVPIPVSIPEPVLPPAPPQIPPVSVRHDEGGDDKLVLIACTMLVLVLLVLGYMYSNGRL